MKMTRIDISHKHSIFKKQVYRLRKTNNQKINILKFRQCRLITMIYSWAKRRVIDAHIYSDGYKTKIVYSNNNL